MTIGGPVSTAVARLRQRWTYRLRYIVNDYGAVGVSVVHGCQGLVSLLTGGIPDLELDCSILVERDGLSEEGGADGRFSKRVELVLGGWSARPDKKSSPTLATPIATHLDEAQDY